MKEVYNDSPTTGKIAGLLSGVTALFTQPAGVRLITLRNSRQAVLPG